MRKSVKKIRPFDMKLRELLQAVKEDNLPLEQVEKYRDELVHLHSAMQLELAELEKKEAIFFHDFMGPEVSDVSLKRRWRYKAEGLRMIELNRFIKACVKEIDSLKSRIYSLL